VSTTKVKMIDMKLTHRRWRIGEQVLYPVRKPPVCGVQDPRIWGWRRGNVIALQARGERVVIDQYGLAVTRSAWELKALPRRGYSHASPFPGGSRRLASTPGWGIPRDWTGHHLMCNCRGGRHLRDECPA
jgi:hypothetical protein